MHQLKIKPIGHRILVQHVKDQDQEQVRGEVIIPDSAEEKPQEAKVIALRSGPKGKAGAVTRIRGEGRRDRIPRARGRRGMDY